MMSSTRRNFEKRFKFIRARTLAMPPLPCLLHLPIYPTALGEFSIASPRFTCKVRGISACVIIYRIHSNCGEVDRGNRNRLVSLLGVAYHFRTLEKPPVTNSQNNRSQPSFKHPINRIIRSYFACFYSSSIKYISISCHHLFHRGSKMFLPIIFLLALDLELAIQDL